MASMRDRKAVAAEQYGNLIRFGLKLIARVRISDPKWMV
jgi:hypothetical protein